MDDPFRRPTVVPALFYGDPWTALDWLDADTDEAGHAFQREAGHPFRDEAGHGSDLKPVTWRSLRGSWR
jgi:hypothetical protein